MTAWLWRYRGPAALVLLVAALTAAWWLGRTPLVGPPPAPAAAHVVFVDTEGWYRRTANEVAAATPIDWRFGSLPGSLPRQLGPWLGVDREPDPAVDEWFRQPEVKIERTYRRADGATVWLSAFGSRGDRSFHLFEHTPESCYPLVGWRFDRLAVTSLPLGPRPLAVNHGEASGPEGRLVVFYLYLWTTPARDAAHGVLSLRLTSPVTGTPEDTYAFLADDFMPRLFSTTLEWRRF